MQHGTRQCIDYYTVARVGQTGAHTMVFRDTQQFNEWMLFKTHEGYARINSENMGLRARIEELEAELQIATAENQRLKAENQRLYEIAHLGSDTSGIPPSKDWKGGGIPEALA
jgi:hypothetical protein